MCDKANNGACDIVYDLQLEIDNLNALVEAKGFAIDRLEAKIVELKAQLWSRSSLNVEMVE